MGGGGSTLIFRPRSHFVSIRFCCIEATRSRSVFVQKRREKPPFCAFTLICLTTKTQRKTSVLCVHIDQMRFQKPPFLWISTFDSVFKNLRFCGVFLRISVNTFTKTEVFSSVFVQKRSSVNGSHF